MSVLAGSGSVELFESLHDGLAKLPLHFTVCETAVIAALVTLALAVMLGLGEREAAEASPSIPLLASEPRLALAAPVKLIALSAPARVLAIEYERAA